jgi:ubiquinone/menaquinone biosynthesis C-methylase UbiE
MPCTGETLAEVPAAETPAAELPAAEANTTQSDAEPVGMPVVTTSNSTLPVAGTPRKPRRSKESFFQLERMPEPESMDHSGEVEAYASAAAQTYLDAIDDTFVAHAQLLLKGRERGRALDIGTGPGQILIKLGTRLTRWKFVGVDRSVAMIEKARQTLANTGEVAGRIEFLVADGNSLDFPDASFDLVVCNSVLHHMAEPQNLFSEIARVVKPGGAILLRDLVRPSRFGYGSHIRKHGKYYSGEMRRLYVASVQAAYTEEELQRRLAASPLRDLHVFRHGKTHIGFERAFGSPLIQK